MSAMAPNLSLNPDARQRAFSPPAVVVSLVRRGSCVNAAVQLANRLSLLFLVLACAFPLRVAYATERVGDATGWYELQQHARTVTALQAEFLGLFEAVPGKESFNSYWTYNLLMGTWLQVDFLQSTLELSIAATSPSDEADLRTTLRDQAQFVLWEIDDANAQLAQNVPQLQRLAEVQNNMAIRRLLSRVRVTVSRLLDDHCAREQCFVR